MVDNQQNTSANRIFWSQTNGIFGHKKKDRLKKKIKKDR